MLNKKELEGVLTLLGYCLSGILIGLISFTLPLNPLLQFIIGCLICVVFGTFTINKENK